MCVPSIYMAVGPYFYMYTILKIQKANGKLFAGVLFLGEGGELHEYFSLLLCWNFFYYKHFQKRKRDLISLLLKKKNKRVTKTKLC